MTPLDPSDKAPETPDQRGDSADALREQAAACRRLASSARTRAGGKALHDLGTHFDERAQKMDQASQRR